MLSSILAAFFAFALPLPSGGQDSKTAKSASAQDKDKASAAADAEKEGAADATKAEKADPEPRFFDPNAAEAIKTIKPLFSGARLTPAQEKDVYQDAQNNTPDSAKLKEFVRYSISQLTSKANIEAMVDTQAGTASQVKAIEDATGRILQAFQIARERDSKRFRSALTKELVDVSKDVLQNNLFARTQFMVALSRSRDEQAINVFISQLNDPEQVLAVKMMAAIGLLKLTDEGRTDLAPNDAIRAARAVADFLGREKETFWPAQVRALEALGALRQSAKNAAQRDAELSERALELLANRDAHPYVRARAAWALGMMRPVNDRFNFLLVADHAGYAAADIGDQLARVSAKNTGLAKGLTDQLLLIGEAFRGDPEIRNSGLLNANNAALSSQQSGVVQVESRIKAVAGAALDVIQSTTKEREKARQELARRVKELRTYLAKNRPPEVALVPGGAKYPLPDASAEAAGQANAPNPERKTASATKSP